MGVDTRVVVLIFKAFSLCIFFELQGGGVPTLAGIKERLKISLKIT